MLANRLFTKLRNGQVHEALSWEISQRRFFDPSFDGALRAGIRNVLLSSAQMTAYTFLDAQRRYSPIVSAMRFVPRPGFGLDWRSDFDPARSKIVNSTLSADVRWTSYFLSIGHSHVACIPLKSVVTEEGEQAVTPCGLERPPQDSLLTPFANQFRGMVGFGQENKRGWNGAFLAIYDYTTGRMQYANTQITYNTACCAYSGQYRRFGFGARNENQYRFAFVIANIGSFGTLRRQERLF
jgi:LPS-assembly protein